MTTVTQITDLIRLHCALARMNGHDLTRKAMSYNSMTDFVLQHDAMSTQDTLRDPARLMELVWSAVETAIPGTWYYTGKPFDREPYRWMEAHPDPLLDKTRTGSYEKISTTQL